MLIGAIATIWGGCYFCIICALYFIAHCDSSDVIPIDVLASELKKCPQPNDDL